jgi:hypothetical protein
MDPIRLIVTALSAGARGTRQHGAPAVLPGAHTELVALARERLHGRPNGAMVARQHARTRRGGAARWPRRWARRGGRGHRARRLGAGRPPADRRSRVRPREVRSARRGRRQSVAPIAAGLVTGNHGQRAAGRILPRAGARPGAGPGVWPGPRGPDQAAPAPRAPAGAARLSPAGGVPGEEHARLSFRPV